jgi:PilZ domain
MLTTGPQLKYYQTFLCKIIPAPPRTDFLNQFLSTAGFAICSAMPIFWRQAARSSQFFRSSFSPRCPIRIMKRSPGGGGKGYFVLKRADRFYSQLPLELVATSRKERSEQPGRAIDVSKGGLRIQTRCSLIPGDQVDVFLRGIAKRYACCRVVWAHQWEGNKIAEAGLQILAESPVVGDSANDFLDELRQAYHNPAGSPKSSPITEIDFPALCA